jgi:hypothetical protein
MEIFAEVVNNFSVSELRQLRGLGVKKKESSQGYKITDICQGKGNIQCCNSWWSSARVKQLNIRLGTLPDPHFMEQNLFQAYLELCTF